jgi:methyltransferase (TIGR00027 family)
MSKHNVSSTALGTLYMRAVHQLLDVRPLILDDHVALKLVGKNTIQHINKNQEYHRTIEDHVMRTHVVLRSRFSEDRLAKAIERGITQYIILGAGFDTFAFRQPPFAHKLKIFEVDQPATQVQKRTLLADAGITIPSNLHFADIDLERESLSEGLIRHGVSLTEPSFFSLLGVTVYLQEEAIDHVIQTIASFPVNSEIVFTFTHPPDLLSERESKFHSSLSKIVADAGEPFVSYFTPTIIEGKLHSAGFKKIMFLSEEEAKKRYFSQYAQDHHISTRSIVCAIL